MRRGDPAFHARVRELFLESAALHAGEREALLERSRAAEPEVDEEVRSLLRFHDSRTILATDEQPQDEISRGSRPGRFGRVPDDAPTVGSVPPLSNRARHALIVAGLAAAVLGGLAWWIHRGVEEAVDRVLAIGLATILEAEVAGLDLWLREQERDVTILAETPAAQRAVTRLAERDASAQATLEGLRETLAPFLAREGRLGFIVIDEQGTVVGTSENREEYLGLTPTEKGLEVLERLRAGETVLLLPYERGALLVDAPTDPSAPIMVVVAPVRAADASFAGALAFSMNPEADFTRLLEVARMGSTGETYAFDSQGRLLSRARFAQELVDAGVLPDDPGVLARGGMLLLRIADPGGDLRRGHRPALPPERWPLTEGVRRAIDSRSDASGVDVEGYRDYRGVEVVGAWTWLPGWDFGVITEADREEALTALPVVSTPFLLLLTVLVLTAGVVAIALETLVRSRRRVRERSRLGAYTLETLVGEGGIGRVWRARHELLRRPTAVKVLRPGVLSDEALRRFESEVQLTSQLTHPNTVAVYDYGRTPEGVFYYAMEYLDGPSLSQLVAFEGPQPPARVVHLLRQVLASLTEAHAHGLVHRDIKPGNVVLCERGGEPDVVKVVDFGLAEGLGPEKPGSRAPRPTVAGTLAYMSPERFDGRSPVDARADVYAVGAVAWYLLAGHATYEGSELAVMGRILDAEPPPSPPAPEIPPELDRWILACMAKDPAARPQTAEDALRGLAALPVGLWTQEQARERWERWERRRAKKERPSQS